jgi:hypothetical protein
VCSFGGSLQWPGRATIATSYQSRGAPRERLLDCGPSRAAEGASRMTGVVVSCAKLLQDGYTEINQFNPANEKTSRSDEVSDAAGQVGD